MKIVLFGAGMLAKYYLSEALSSTVDNIVCFLDNDSAKWGTRFWGLDVYSPNIINQIEFDKIVICNVVHDDAISKQLVENGVPENCIETVHDFHDGIAAESDITRNRWVFDYSELLKERNVSGDVAEVGVYRGNFSRVLNFLFSDRELQLYDTFEGFSDKDFGEEPMESDIHANFANTSIDLVLGKMHHPEMVTIHKGYFPDTFSQDAKRYCFVNLDVDLYQPTLAGLQIFYPLLNTGGAILVHDYWSSNFPNVQLAVRDFLLSNIPPPHPILPIGDGKSLAIVKY